MKIGVTGASGHLGKSVLSELLSRSSPHSVIGISRTPDSIRDDVEGRYGDYDAPESLASAYEGLERLLIIPSADMRPGVRERQFTAAIDAAVGAGVKLVALISSVATKEPMEPGMNSAYWTGEQHLMKTAPHWTILRMNYYAETFMQMAPTIVGSGVLLGLTDNRVAFVSRDDLAAAAAGILVSDGHNGAIYNATGPNSITATERAALLSEVFGKPTRFIALDENQFGDSLKAAGIPAGYIGSMIEIERHFASGSYDIVTGDVEHLPGRKPKSLRGALTSLAQYGGR